MAVDYDTSQVMSGLVGAINTLTSDANYKLVTDVFHDVLYLKEQNTRLSIGQRELFEEYRKFRNELEANEAQLTSAKHALESTVREKLKELEDLEGVRVKLEGDLTETNEKLDEERKKVQDMTEQISGLQQSLEERGTEVETLQDEVRAMGERAGQASQRADELGQTLNEIREELKAKSLRLGEIESYSIALKDEPEDE